MSCSNPNDHFFKTPKYSRKSKTALNYNKIYCQGLRKLYVNIKNSMNRY